MEGTDYKVRLDIFEGPLDLLLYLIKKDEIDIYDISIERITSQYLGYLETFRMLNIDLASEFIVMAANLMYIKSRTLLPRQEQPPEEDVEEDDPRWELIRQLIEYKKFKDAAGFLSQCEIDQAEPLRPPPRRVIGHAAGTARTGRGLHLRPDPGLPERPQALRGIPRTGDIIDDRFTVADKIDHLLDDRARPAPPAASTPCSPRPAAARR